MLGFLLAKPSAVHAQYGSTHVKVTRVSPVNMGAFAGTESVTGSVIGFRAPATVKARNALSQASKTP